MQSPWPWWRLLIAMCVPAALIGGGTLGYVLIEHWPAQDALFMTVITLTTIGYGETHPLTADGRLFTMALALGGAFTLAAAATTVIRSIISGELNTILGRQRMERSIQGLHDHIIVCGYGRVGRRIVEELRQANVPCVVIERDDIRAKTAPIHIVGDVTSDAVLKRAGIDRARALISVVPKDADNLFVTMSARLLNDKVTIVARSEGEGSEEKLRRAGATRVISPTAIGGQQMVQAVLRPAVLDFIDLTTRTQHLELQMEQTALLPSSGLVGQTLADANLRERAGVLIVAVQGKDGGMTFNPPPSRRLESGDRLVVLGDRASLDAIEALAKAP
jgi:voltage-gated potassium channel